MASVPVPKTPEAARTEPGRLRDAPRAMWVVFASAFLGWMFDAMDVYLFSFVLMDSIGELANTADPAVIGAVGGIVLAVKLVAWGAGGIMFGFAADRFGRARIMMLTIILYAVFTAASALATSWQLLALFQALAGIGIGGEWAAGTALVVETWPERLRTKIMQLLQMGFALGFFAAATLYLVVGPHGWRWVFACGLIPIVVAAIVRRFVREPERWARARAMAADAAGTVGGTAVRVTGARRLFGRPLRRNTVAGILLSMVVMIGAWGSLAWAPAWIVELTPVAEQTSAGANVSYAFMLFNVGAVVGFLAVMWLPDLVGRRGTYLIFCAGSLVTTLTLFTQVHTIGALFLLMPICGVFVSGALGAVATYLPELFPTVVRAAGQGVSYNAARFLTAGGVLASGALVSALGSYPAASAVVATVYAVGFLVAWLAPETKGHALEDV